MQRSGKIVSISTHANIGLRCALIFGVLMTHAFTFAEDKTVDFNRDVLPIFAERCFSCHGPDAAVRKGGLRLHVRSSAFDELPSGNRAIVAGDATTSELIRRVAAEDASLRMPPPKHGKPLSSSQIKLLSRWIDAGAEWTTHWAYVAPHRPPLPSIPNVSHPIDTFVRQRAFDYGLTPSPPASKRQQLRRVSLALIGLPPTIEQQQRFLNDNSPDAYERLVDRLLTSPHYGEQMAVPWLDLARYADTHGYHMDAHRDMWRWRDWVIDALNRGMHYDQFTIEQLAGDLLPRATMQQQLASAFHRNTMINYENGAIPDEYLNEYVADRVHTTATIWMGQTFRCARCHDHKYDPFTQRDYYRLYAFFNRVPESGVDGNDGNAQPYLRTPTDLQVEELATLSKKIVDLKRLMSARKDDSKTDQRAWEAAYRQANVAAKTPGGMSFHLDFEQDPTSPIIDRVSETESRVVGTRTQFPDKFGNCILFDGETRIEFDHVAQLKANATWSISAWLFPTTTDPAIVIAREDGTDDKRGYSLGLSDGHVVVRLTNKLADDGLAIRSESKLVASTWQHVAVTYDGSGKAAGLRIFIDGVATESTVSQDNLRGSIRTPVPTTIGSATKSRAFRGMLDEFRIYPRTLDATEIALLAGSNPINDLVAIDAAKRTPEQSQRLSRYYLEHEDTQYRALLGRLRDAAARERQVKDAVPTTMIMSDAATRKTFVLARGNYASPREEVTADIPASLPRLPKSSSLNRLDLARWLVSPNNPLTARVTVNRYWQQHFGAGIVRSSENFGTRGTLPTHPQLLDWLAVEFIESGWDSKRMHRLIVTSDTFRQQTGMSSEHVRLDPTNKWLSRGPRLSLPAESVRDNALAIAGLLDQRIGGRSVFPYQPPGLWKELSYNANDYTAQQYTQSHGADLFRRGLYTFWKRSVVAPALDAFGAPTRETCVVKRPTSITPMQTLVLMNDPTFVEAARVFAERILLEGGDDDEARIRFAYLASLCREPDGGETSTLQQLLTRQRAAFAERPSAAASLLSVGEAPRTTTFNDVELATWTTIASVVLTLDEVVTRE